STVTVPRPTGRPLAYISALGSVAMIATGCVDERKNEQPGLPVTIARSSAVARVRLGVRMAGALTLTVHAACQRIDQRPQPEAIAAGCPWTSHVSNTICPWLLDTSTVTTPRR